MWRGLAVRPLHGNLADRRSHRHDHAMRRILAVTFLVVAGCARVPTEQPKTPSVPITPQPREAGTLIGLSGAELVGRLGRPELQIREGNSLKVQFRGRTCVLDAFLYPGAGSQYRVTHVESRNVAGTDLPQQVCISDIDLNQ